MATAGLLAHIVVSKFEDALPFHRQSKQFARLGIDLPRATLCNWARQVAEKTSPLADLMDGRSAKARSSTSMRHRQVLQEPVVPTRRNPTCGSFVARPERPMLRYQYHPTSRQRAVELSCGFRACSDRWLQGYDALGRKPHCHGGCWAHARRKFHEVLQAAGSQLANRGLAAEEAFSSSPGSTGSKRGPFQAAFSTGTLPVAPAAAKPVLEN